jgi:hypothetical protein
VEWSGVEWSGVEWSGVEWSGVEWSGVTSSPLFIKKFNFCNVVINKVNSELVHFSSKILLQL